MPLKDWAEHKLFWALSIIDEAALRNFSATYARSGAPSAIDGINAELDLGICIEDMFANSEAIKNITDNDCIEFQVMWHGEDLNCTIRLGLMTWCGAGAEWDVRFRTRDLPLQAILVEEGI
ncbi:MAG: hypothetical protein IPI00_17900 [Flavobacteriales bacterium]|nr:hypothetical protein [Flavobacteriales bacterium]